MVKKMKSSAEQMGEQVKGKASKAAASLMDSQLASSVKESAQQIWLAGMGAFSKAQEEGTKVFEALVKEGTNLQKKTQGLAEDKISEVTGKMSAMAGTVTAKAGQNWDKLESIFEQRTAKAMNKLGVPTAKDVDALVKRVDELATAVAKLSKGGAKAAVKGAATPFTKPAVKRATKPLAKAPLKRARRMAAA
jgi:poly(hydroxyalkanoate) granule-associated protein